MKLTELKSDFHLLIDQIEDPQILEQFYDALNNSVNSGNSLWATLTPEQQKEVLAAYEESEDENNLVPLSVIKSKSIK
jgi:hypothetical protein